MQSFRVRLANAEGCHRDIKSVSLGLVQRSQRFGNGRNVLARGGLGAACGQSWVDGAVGLLRLVDRVRYDDPLGGGSASAEIRIHIFWLGAGRCASAGRDSEDFPCLHVDRPRADRRGGAWGVVLCLGETLRLDLASDRSGRESALRSTGAHFSCASVLCNGLGRELRLLGGVHQADRLSLARVLLQRNGACHVGFRCLSYPKCESDCAEGNSGGVGGLTRAELGVYARPLIHNP